MTIEIVPASTLHFTRFVKAFNESYSDYIIPMHIEREAMRRLITRDAIDLDHSFGAVLNGEIVGVGMLAIENKVGWIGGMGVVPAYRRQGIGRRLMQALIDTAQACQLGYVELEVIEQNEKAFRLYQSLGFKTMRNLLIVERQPSNNVAEPLRQDAHSIAAADLLGHFQPLHAVVSPWQRRYSALRALEGNLEGWGILQDHKPIAYAMGWVTPEVIRLMDVAFATDHANALAAVLSHVHAQSPMTPVSLINLPEDDPAYAVMKGLGYQKTMGQYEMRLEL